MLFVKEDDPAVVWAELLGQRNEPAGLRALSLASHIPILFPIIACLLLGRRYFAATLLGLSLVTSLLYHTCLAYDVCGGASVVVRRSADHVTANLDIVAAVSLIIGTREDGGTRARQHLDFMKIVVPLQILAVVYGVLVAPFSIYIAYVAFAAAMLAVLAYGLFFRPSSRLSVSAGAYVIEPYAFSVPYLIGAIVAAGGGIACFLIDIQGASWPHSLWHVLIALAIGFLALATGLPPDAPTTVIAYRLARADKLRLQSRLQSRRHVV